MKKTITITILMIILLTSFASAETYITSSYMNVDTINKDSLNHNFFTDKVIMNSTLNVTGNTYFTGTHTQNGNLNMTSHDIFDLDKVTFSNGKVEIGTSTTRALMTTSIAIGTSADSKSKGSIAIGNNSLAGFRTEIGHPIIYRYNDIAIGNNAIAEGENSSAIGNNAIAEGYSSISIGNNANASDSYSLAIGSNTISSGYSSIVIGKDSFINKNYDYAIALGTKANSSGNLSIAIGKYTNSSGYGSIAIGGLSVVTNSSGIAIGTEVVAGYYGTAIGTETSSTGEDSLAMLYRANATEEGAMSIGARTSATGINAIALGYYTNNTIANSFKVGGDMTHVFFDTTLNVTGNINANNFNWNESSSKLLIGNNISSNGTFMTAIGYMALDNFQGSSVVSIGRKAGMNSSSSSSVFIGTNAGYINTGTSSVFVGHQAGYNNSGQQTNGIGFQAGYNNSGEYGSFYGRESGYNNSGNNVVAIGHQAGKDNSIDNQFILKQNIINAVPLIQGDFLTGVVNISGALYVNGTSVGADGYIGDSQTHISGGELNMSGNNITNINQLLFNDTHIRVGDITTIQDWNSTTLNTYSVAIGSEAFTNSSKSIVIGHQAEAFSYGGKGIAIGDNSEASGINSPVALGERATATGNYATSIGANAQATQTSSLAVGYNAQATGGFGCTAVGTSSKALGGNSFAMGYLSEAKASAVAVGSSAFAEDYAISLGNLANASGTYSLSMGRYTDATAQSSIAIGGGLDSLNTGALASGVYSIALGWNTSATATGSISIGAGTDNAEAYTLKVGGAMTDVFLDTNVTIDGSLNVTGGIVVAENVSADNFFDGHGHNIHQAVIGKLIGLNETGFPITLTNADTYYQYTGEIFTPSNASKHVTYNATNHSLIVQQAGIYYINAGVSAEVDNAGSRMHMAFSKNDVTSVYGVSGAENKDAGSVIQMSVSNAPMLEVGDEIKLVFKSDNAGDVISVYHLNMVMFLIGDT